METSSFQRSAEAILDEILSWEPTYATHLGWHKYDDHLPDRSTESVRNQLDRMGEIVNQLQRMDEEALSGDESIDRDLAVHFLRLRMFELADLRMFEKSSMAASEIGDALFFLFARDYLPIEPRFKAILARLEDIPRFLTSSRKIVKTPIRLWNEIQHETGERLPQFLKEIEGVCEERCRDGEMKRRLRSAIRDASAAIVEHNIWLKKEIIPNSSDTYAIGPSLYRLYLLRKGYGVTPEETLRVAELYLEEVNKQKTDLSNKIVGANDPQAALMKMRQDHPSTSRDVLEAYKVSVVKAREFIESMGLVTLPPGEKLHIMETPSFMRHLTAYAAQFEPGKFDDDMNGIFLVTPDDGNPALLEEHNYASIANTSVHEGYPGHHLHGVCMNVHPSFIRPLYQSSDFAEGWALYCEDMMLSQGYNDNPIGRMAILNDLAFRIARQICDVKMSTNAMSVEKAAELISAQTGTNMKAATSEARAIMLSPTYFMSYFIGKLGILQIRDEVQRVMGAGFDLRFFHDSLIYSGCMPMSFMRRAVALRMKEKFALELGQSRETLSEYALRKLNRRGA